MKKAQQSLGLESDSGQDRPSDVLGTFLRSSLPLLGPEPLQHCIADMNGHSGVEGGPGEMGDLVFSTSHSHIATELWPSVGTTLLPTMGITSTTSSGTSRPHTLSLIHI